MSAERPRKRHAPPGSGRQTGDRTSSPDQTSPPNVADSPRRLDEITELVGELRELFRQEGAWGILSPGAAEVQRELLRIADEYRELSLQGGAALKNVPIGSPGAGLRRPACVAEAAAHAIEVLQRDTQCARITFATSLTRDAADASCGPLYAVLLQGLRNAAEAVRRAGDNGRVVLRARIEKTAGRTLRIEIEDDGVGPPHPPTAATPGRSGRGTGLTICDAIVTHLGGTIELVPGSGSGSRPGAVLRILCPTWPEVTGEDKAAA